MEFTDEYNADCLAEIARRAKHFGFTVNDWDDAIVLRDHLLDLGHDPSRGLLLIVATHLTERVNLVPKKKSPWSNNGGARKGAGRKPKTNAKHSVNLRMSPDIVAWIKSLDNQSVEVEAILRRCKAFREFNQ